MESFVDMASLPDTVPHTVMQGMMKTAAELDRWLSMLNVPTHEWGQGSAKTVEHLLKEV
jgi:hypothetical protein